MIERIFPRAIDTTYRGQWPGIIFFALYIALKLIMSVNSIANTRGVMTGADAIPLDAYGEAGAGAMMSLFALLAISQLSLAVVALIALVRYRSMIPLIYLVLLFEHFARRSYIALHPIERSDPTPAGFYINVVLSVLLMMGFALSVWTRREHRQSGRQGAPS